MACWPRAFWNPKTNPGHPSLALSSLAVTANLGPKAAVPNLRVLKVDRSNLAVTANPGHPSPALSSLGVTANPGPRGVGRNLLDPRTGKGRNAGKGRSSR